MSSRVFTAAVIVVSLIVGVASNVCVAESEIDEFDTVVVPFLRQHCVRCHGAKKHESQLMLHKMTGKAGAADCTGLGGCTCPARRREHAAGR